AFPLDARVRTVTVDGQAVTPRVEADGDVQRVRVDIAATTGAHEVVFTQDEGTDVYARVEVPARGAASEDVRIVRARAEGPALHLVLDGLAGRTYRLGVRSPRKVGGAPGVTVTPSPLGADLAVSFEGAPGTYVRRSVSLPLS